MSCGSTHIFPFAGPIDPECAICRKTKSQIQREDEEARTRPGKRQRIPISKQYQRQAPTEAPDLVDQILQAVAKCHDGSELWNHLLMDLDAFRAAVRAALGPLSDVASVLEEVLSEPGTDLSHEIRVKAAAALKALGKPG